MQHFSRGASIKQGHKVPHDVLDHSLTEKGLAKFVEDARKMI